MLQSEKKKPLYLLICHEVKCIIFVKHATFNFPFFFFTNCEHLLLAGAQSDSELPSASGGDNLSDRGYTSDSEISYDRQMSAQRSPSPLEIRPIPDNGSWLLVKIPFNSNFRLILFGRKDVYIEIVKES